MKKHIPNIITSCRVVGSILLLFSNPFSMLFYIVYLLCGFSDMIDGAIARKINSVSKYGARFDTVADLLFVAVCLIKLLPIIHISYWLWIWIIAITIIKISNHICGYICKKKLICMHTVMNKITGLLLFLLPLTLDFIETTYSFVAVCFIATFSAIQEGYYVWAGQEIIQPGTFGLLKI